MALFTQSTINTQKGSPAQISVMRLTDGACALSNPGLAIDTNFDVKCANSFDIVTGGIFVTVAADVSWDTGTTKAIDTGSWAAALLSIDDDGSTTALQWTADAASEAAAIALLPGLTPTYDTVIGYVTVTTHATNSWTAGTDALQGGTGGNVSADTNYYNICGWVQ